MTYKVLLMDKGEIIRDICQKFLDDNQEEGRQIAYEKYTFVSYRFTKRNNTPFHQIKVFLRDGFIVNGLIMKVGNCWKLTVDSYPLICPFS